VKYQGQPEYLMKIVESFFCKLLKFSSLILIAIFNTKRLENIFLKAKLKKNIFALATAHTCQISFLLMNERYAFDKLYHCA